MTLLVRDLSVTNDMSLRCLAAKTMCALLSRNPLTHWKNGRMILCWAAVTSTYTETAIQSCDFSACSVVPKKALIRRCCLTHRQSTPDQVHNNLESQHRQYASVDRAKELGWAQGQVIDEDLGRSGSGCHRQSFERLLGAS